MQPHPVPLSDDELAVLRQLAAPIDNDLRQAFLTAVALELRRYAPEDIGPGTVFRTAKALQREFFIAPAAGNFKIGKYR